MYESVLSPSLHAVIPELPARALEIGLVLPLSESFVDGSTPHWTEIRELAVVARVRAGAARSPDEGPRP